MHYVMNLKPIIFLLAPHVTLQCLLARPPAHSALAHIAILAKIMSGPGTRPRANKLADALTKGRGTQVAPPSGSVAQFAVIPLLELNQRSAQIGTWNVVVRQPRTEEYQYLWDAQQRFGNTFSCLLVSTDGSRD